MVATQDGGGFSAVPFKHINCVDFEFDAHRGNRPEVVCMVARELRSGQVWRLWRDDLRRLSRAPFQTGDGAVMVAHAGQAELGCFAVLGWPRPQHILCTYAEFRSHTNGARRNASLLDALAYYNLPHIDSGMKDAMRDLVLQRDWSNSQKIEILDYCESDVDAVAALVQAMAAKIDWPRATIRGEYTAAVAAMEHAGVPIDHRLLRKICRKWPDVRRRLIEEVDRAYGIFDGETFKRDRFSRMLNQVGIPWPRLESGLLDLSDDAFKQQEVAWPVIAPLRELRATIRQADLKGLQVAPDARARTSLRPFASVTGRNQPSTTSFPFGTAKWMRGFIAPPQGYGMAMIDFSAQEIGIAAGLSGDERLIAAYINGDPYLGFAKQAGRAPPDATKHSHPEIRNACKVVVLGVNYGMGAESMALQAGISVAHARELMALHRRTYRDFWKWSDGILEAALLSRQMRSALGWNRRLVGGERITSLRNFPMQSNGAEMMRVAAIGAVRAGIEVCAPVHDAFLIVAPLGQLEHDVEIMRDIMTQAGQLVCGVPIRTEAKLIRYPDRYMEERGIEMWNRVARLANFPTASFEGEATA